MVGKKRKLPSKKVDLNQPTSKAIVRCSSKKVLSKKKTVPKVIKQATRMSKPPPKKKMKQEPTPSDGPDPVLKREGQPNRQVPNNEIEKSLPIKRIRKLKIMFEAEPYSKSKFPTKEQVPKPNSQPKTTKRSPIRMHSVLALPKQPKRPLKVVKPTRNSSIQMHSGPAHDVELEPQQPERRLSGGRDRIPDPYTEVTRRYPIRMCSVSAQHMLSHPGLSIKKVTLPRRMPARCQTKQDEVEQQLAPEPQPKVISKATKNPPTQKRDPRTKSVPTVHQQPALVEPQRKVQSVSVQSIQKETRQRNRTQDDGNSEQLSMKTNPMTRRASTSKNQPTEKIPTQRRVPRAKSVPATHQKSIRSLTLQSNHIELRRAHKKNKNSEQPSVKTELEQEQPVSEGHNDALPVYPQSVSLLPVKQETDDKEPAFPQLVPRTSSRKITQHIDPGSQSEKPRKVPFSHKVKYERIANSSFLTGQFRPTTSSEPTLCSLYTSSYPFHKLPPPLVKVDFGEKFQPANEKPKNSIVKKTETSEPSEPSEPTPFLTPPAEPNPEHSRREPMKIKYRGQEFLMRPLFKNPDRRGETRTLINDTLIEFYLQYYMVEELFDDVTRAKVHVFNSFFYTGLLTKVNTHVKIMPRISDLACLFKKMYPKLNSSIFDKEIIVVPVFMKKPNHWMLALIHNPSRSVLRLSEPRREPEIISKSDNITDSHIKKIGALLWNNVPLEGLDSECRILLFDSLRGSDKYEKVLEEQYENVFGYLKFFIQCFAAARGEKPFGSKIKKVVCQNAPQQQNQVDCGIYMLSLAEYFTVHYTEWMTWPTETLVNLQVDELTSQRLCTDEPREYLERLIKSLSIDGPTDEN